MLSTELQEAIHDCRTELRKAERENIEGNLRPVDIPGVGADETGTEYDIGAYEAQPRQANHTLVSRSVRPLLQEI